MDARAFLRTLGPGINVMASTIRDDQLDDADWHGLGLRVGHIRLCGDVLKGLIDWTTCPGTAWVALAGTPEAEVVAEARARIVGDPGFARYKRAAQAVLRSGAQLVLNPLHWKFMVTLDEALIRHFWAVMLSEFNTTAFPPDRVAFEGPCNEPGNWNLWGVSSRAADLLGTFVELVHAAQPTRVIIVPAGEMGRPRCRPAGPALHFINSWQAAVADATALDRFATDPHVILTFHYYDPRRFTNQPNGTALEWDTSSGLRTIAGHFDAVRAALPINLPIYLGEFGVNVPFVPEASGVAWLQSVRTEAEARHFGWALWTYYRSDEGIVLGDDGLQRMHDWDCSVLAGAVFSFRPPLSTMCDGQQLWSWNVSSGRQARRRRRRLLCNDHRPDDVPEPTRDRESARLPCSPTPPPYIASPSTPSLLRPPSRLPPCWLQPPPSAPPPPVLAYLPSATLRAASTTFIFPVPTGDTLTPLFVCVAGTSAGALLFWRCASRFRRLASTSTTTRHQHSRLKLQVGVEDYDGVGDAGR